MAFDFAGIRSALAGLKGQLKSLNGKLEALHQERDLLISAPVSREDAVAEFQALVDEAAGRHQKALGEAVFGAALSGRPEKFSFVSYLVAGSKSGTPTAAPVLEGVISLFLGDALKVGVARVLAEMEWPDGAISLAERQTRLAKLDAEIASLESQRDELAAEAARAGLSIY